MSATLNEASFIGRPGGKVELSYPKDGLIIGRFDIATDESYFDKTTNEKVKKTFWHQCVVFGKQAEFLAQNMEKGSLIHLKARGKNTSWEGKGGEKRYGYEFEVLGNVQFLSRPSNNSNNGVAANQ